MWQSEEEGIEDNVRLQIRAVFKIIVVSVNVYEAFSASYCFERAATFHEIRTHSLHTAWDIDGLQVVAVLQRVPINILQGFGKY